MEQLRDSAFTKDCASITDGILGTALNHRWYISSYNSQNGLFPLLAGVFFPSLIFIFCTWQLQTWLQFFKGPLKTFYFNDACNLFLFGKSNTKISIFSEIKTYLILIGLHLCFIWLAYLSSVSFLFSWISSTFPCYLLKYCIRHKLLPRLRQSSSCCCPLMGHIPTPYSLWYLNPDPGPAKDISIAQIHPILSCAWLGWCISALSKIPVQSGRGWKEGRGRRGERSIPWHITFFGKASLSLCFLCRAPKASRYFTKVGKGKGIWTSSKQLSLKTTDGNREIWGSTSSQWHCDRSLHNTCPALHISASPLSRC